MAKLFWFNPTKVLGRIFALQHSLSSLLPPLNVVMQMQTLRTVQTQSNVQKTLPSSAAASSSAAVATRPRGRGIDLDLACSTATAAAVLSPQSQQKQRGKTAEEMFAVIPFEQDRRFWIESFIDAQTQEVMLCVTPAIFMSSLLARLSDFGLTQKEFDDQARVAVLMRLDENKVSRNHTQLTMRRRESDGIFTL